MLADAAEALVAAVYEARGLEGARALVHDIVRRALRARRRRSASRDPKSALQERRAGARAAAADVPRRRACGAPPHEQVFVVEVLVGDAPLARGEGRSKRLAERAAALRALHVVAVEEQEEPP